MMSPLEETISILLGTSSTKKYENDAVSRENMPEKSVFYGILPDYGARDFGYFETRTCIRSV
tara:strand:- start:2468 stop:2653 length:186 start_codon:yes stop_codon:yes gene_type:complete